MGNTDDQPQPGFDHWISFQGQGVYYNPTFNINGKRIKQAEGSYITDLLTDNALEWMGKSNKNKPFFLFLSLQKKSPDKVFLFLLKFWR